MATFKPLTGIREPNIKELPVTTATTLTKHNLCKMSSGYLVAASAGDNEVEYLALETVTNSGASGAVTARMLVISDEIDFEAECATTPVQASHVGNDYDMASAATLDLTATTDKVFHIDEIVDATNKLVRGHFNKPALA